MKLLGAWGFSLCFLCFTLYAAEIKQPKLTTKEKRRDVTTLKIGEPAPRSAASDAKSVFPFYPFTTVSGSSTANTPDLFAAQPGSVAQQTLQPGGERSAQKRIVENRIADVRDIRPAVVYQSDDGTKTVYNTGEVVLSALPHAQDEILVRFKDGVSPNAEALADARVGARVVKKFRHVRNLKRVKLPTGVSVEAALRSYIHDPNVLYAEPNYIVKTHATPNDPNFGQLWGFHNIGQPSIDPMRFPGTPDADIDAPDAWNLTTGSNNVVVAVIDTGVDYNHQDLATNMWRNTADCNNNGIDDDGNGYIDDCHGIDTINNDSDPMDDSGHGTHVSGIIGAVGNNEIGVVGVNWNVSIMACKFLDASGVGYISGAIECLEYVRTMKDRGVNIVATNNSWGGGVFSQALYDAIDAHVQRGILFIAAAGNSRQNNDLVSEYPASYYLPNIISVAASTREDAFASFSSVGRRTVHLVAPGEEILSTIPGNSYEFFSGTSMAAPHVTGVAALLKAHAPSRDWKVIKNRILAGGDNFSPPYGIPSGEPIPLVTQKRLNANRALTCSSSTVLTRLWPVKNALEVAVGKSVDLSVLHINCGNANGNVSIGVSPGSLGVTLRDDGLGFDRAAGDGIYSGRWTPSSGGNYTLTFPGGDTVTVKVDPDLQPGFPVKSYHGPGTAMGGPVIHTLVGNIDSDPNLEILATSLAIGPLNAWKSDGKLAPGWPLNEILGAAYPALGNLSNGSSGAGIMVGYYGRWPDNAKLVAYSGSGARLPGWARDSANFITSPPTLADTDGDGLDEIFIGEEDGLLHGYKYDGSLLPGWPTSRTSAGFQDRFTPAIADLDGDGSFELITTSIEYLFAYQQNGALVNGFPVSLGGMGRYVAVGDVDGDGSLEIVAPVRTGAGTVVNIFSRNGVLKRSIPLAGNLFFFTAPALADLDGDGIPEIIVQTDGALNVVRGNGSVFPGWPVTWTGRLLGFSSPVVGDVDGDGLPDIVITTQDSVLRSVSGDVRVYNRNGVLHPRFPKTLPIGSGAVPAIADIDLDGRNEIIVTGSYWNGFPGYYDKVWVYDLGGGKHGPIEWGQFMGGPKHQGVYRGRSAVPLPSITINDVLVPEGHVGFTNAVFSVTLSSPSSQTVAVTYSTANGTATAGSDYVSKSGTLIFNPGDTTKTITVQVYGDTIAEPDENFFVNLTGATNAVIADGQGVGTIVNDDIPVPYKVTPDFDGDFMADVAVYRDGAWSIMRSSDGVNTVFGWGGPDWIPLPGDYDGDGKTDIAVYHRDGVWSIVRSSDGGNTVVGWGGPGWVPVPGDYDGDGKTDVAVYHNDGAWAIVRSSDGGTTIVGWGGPGWTPVPGDYDGDGRADIAVHDAREGSWAILRSSDTGTTVVGWGGPGWVPVPGDYDGDGKTDIAVYRNDGVWAIIRSSDEGTTIVGWGGPDWAPVPGDYDGDGKTDVAVYKDGAWSIKRSSDGGTMVIGWGGFGWAPVRLPN